MNVGVPSGVGMSATVEERDSYIVRGRAFPVPPASPTPVARLTGIHPLSIHPLMFGTVEMQDIGTVHSTLPDRSRPGVVPVPPASPTPLDRSTSIHQLTFGSLDAQAVFMSTSPGILLWEAHAIFSNRNGN
jgi:hypothetical protein